MRNRRRHRIVSLFLLVSLLLALSTTANAKKYKCERVDNIAHLGVPDGSKVNIEDGTRDDETEGKYCASAVNGVAASSPPLPYVLKAFDRLE